MSSAHSSAARVLPAPALPAPVPKSPERLRLVQAPAQARSRVPFLMLCMGLLGAALLGTLLLNTAMNNGAYEAKSLQQQIAKEAERSDQLRAQIDALTSPQALASRAAELGMVQNPNPGIIRLADESVIGGVSPAGGGR